MSVDSSTTGYSCPIACGAVTCVSTCDDSFDIDVTYSAITTFYDKYLYRQQILKNEYAPLLFDFKLTTYDIASAGKM